MITVNRTALAIYGFLVCLVLVALVGCSPTVVAVPIGDEPLDSASGARPEVTPFVLDIVERNLFYFFMFLKNFTSLYRRAGVSDLNKGLNTIKDR
jgi:hypothetical protein